MRSANCLPGEPASSIGGVYDELLAAPHADRPRIRLRAAFWDIGTPEDLAQTSADLEERKQRVGSLFRRGSAKKTPTPFSE